MRLSSKKIIIIFTFFTVFILVVLGLSTLRQIKGHKPFSLQRSFGTHRYRPVTVSDVMYISPWMTFDYINKLFDLPQDYLKDSLQIVDTKYPFLTIGDYTKKANTNTAVAIQTIRFDVKKYVTASSSPK
jgi:hypothetical protein